MSVKTSRVLCLLLVVFCAVGAFAQNYVCTLNDASQCGDSRWPGLNPTIPEPTYPSLCTQVVGSNGEPAGVLYANQIAGSLSNTADTRIQTALNTCKPTLGNPAVGLELKSNGSNNAFVIPPITLPVGVTLIVDPDVIVFAYYNSGSTTALITPAVNTGSSVVAFNGGAMGYWGIMGYGIIDGQGSAWGWNGNGPRMIQLGGSGSSAVDYFTLYQITLQNAGKMHVIGTGSYLLAYDVKISTAADSANTDGIDPSASHDITIVNSWISDGDDHISPKAGSSPGPLANLTIAHNHLFSGHGISVGSETNTNSNNMLVTDVAIDNNGGYGSNSKNSLRIKSDATRGGEVKDVLYEGVCIQNGGHVLVFDPYYSSGSGSKIPNTHDVTLHNVHVLDHDSTGHNGASTLQGYDGSHILTMTMSNVIFNGYNVSTWNSEFPALATQPTGGSNSGVRNATFTLGPDPVTPGIILLGESGSNGITVNDNRDPNSTATPYDCTSKYGYLATELFGSASTVGAGGSFNLTAIVQPIPAPSWKFSPAFTPPAPTGTITIYDNGQQIAQQTVTAPAVSYTCAGSSAKCSSMRSLTTIPITNVTAGTHVYTATYANDSYYLPSSMSAGISAVGNPSGGMLPVAPTFPSYTIQVGTTPPSTTTVTPSATTLAYGSSISYSASVTANGGTPTGTVAFTDKVSNVTMDQATITLSGGAAGWSPTALPVAGAHTITATYSGDSNFSASSGSATFTVSRATVTASVTAASKTYDGTTAATITGCALTSGVVGSDDVGCTAAGTFGSSGQGTGITVTATVGLTGTKAGNYTLASATATTAANITQATPTITLTCPAPVTYDGAAHGCTATATGVGGAAVTGSMVITYNGSTTVPSAKATYTVVATFTSGDGNYTNGTPATGSLSIVAVVPVVTVTCPGNVTYDGNTHGCTAAATANSTPIPGTFAWSPAATEINAGTYLMTATFTPTDQVNYGVGSTGQGSLVIAKATPTVTVTCPSNVTYDGNAHGCTAAAAGVLADGNIAGTYAWSPAQSRTAAGSSTVTATFTSGNGNYNSGAQGSATLAIAQATVTAAVTAQNKTYDGGVTATVSCTLTSGVMGADSGNLTCAAAAAAFGSANVANGITVTATGITLSGTAAPNYTLSATTATTTANITTATPVVAVTCAAATYDGSAHGCTAAATGVGGAAVTGTFAWSPAQSQTNAGSSTVTATFTSTNGNYSSGAQGTGTLAIAKATPVVTVTCPSGITYDGNAHSCTAAAAGVGTDGNITSQGSFGWSPAANETSAGSYPLTATFTPTNSSGNYNASGTGTATLTIAAVTPGITSWTPAEVVANGAAFTLTVTGTNFLPGAVVSWNGSARTTTVASATSLTAAITAADLAAVGTASVTVTNPAASGGVSVGPVKIAIDTAAGTTGAATVTATTQTLTVTKGQTGSLAVSFTGTTATAQITASCVNLPSGITCGAYDSASKSVPVTVAAGVAAGQYQITVIFTVVQTPATTAALGHGGIWLGAWLGLPLGLLWVGGRNRKARHGVWLALVALLLLAGLVGCGGKSTPKAVTSQSSVGITLTVQ